MVATFHTPQAFFYNAMDADDYFDPMDEHNDGLRYTDVATLEGWEIPTALQGLALFRNFYLSMQAQNLAIVDHFLNGLEQHVMRRLFEEDRTPIDDATRCRLCSRSSIITIRHSISK